MTTPTVSSQTETRLMELSACEQFLQALHDKFPGAGSFTALLRWRGQADPETLRRAFQALQMRHPLLRAAIVSRGKGLYYDIAENAPEIPIEWIDTDDRERWKTEAVKRSRIPFQVDRPPFLRLTVLQRPGSGWCDLLLTMHHVIADGRAVATMLQDLQAVWPAARNGQVTLPPQNWQCPVVPRKRGSLREALRRLRQRFAQRRQLRNFPRAKFDKLKQPYVSCCREVLSKDETTQLRGRCRTAETTTYGAIAAATLKVLGHAPQHQGCRFRVDSPIDFRTVCEPRLGYDQVGCYVWIVGYQVTPPEGTPFWELARECRQQLETTWQAGSFQRIWAWLPWLLPLYKARRSTRRGRESGIVSINDMGALRATTGDPDFVLEEVGWYSNREHAIATFAVNAAMVEGRLNLTFASPSHTPEQLQTVAASISQTLRDAAQPVTI